MTSEQDREALAGEYVLGLLDGAQREAFERDIDHDRELDTAVERWRARFAVIDQSALEISPSPEVWPRIEAGLSKSRIAKQAASHEPDRASMLQQWWDSLWLWRGAAFAGLALAAILGGTLFLASTRADRQPVLVAVLLTDANVAAAVVNTFADGRTELLPLQDIAVPKGRALQIWTLWDRQTGPRSVGLIDQAKAAPLQLTDLPLGPNQLFEITLEPASGSPTGRPTGPIIAKGLTARSL